MLNGQWQANGSQGHRHQTKPLQNNPGCFLDFASMKAFKGTAEKEKGWGTQCWKDAWDLERADSSLSLAHVPHLVLAFVCSSVTDGGLWCFPHSDPNCYHYYVKCIILCYITIIILPVA